MRHLCKTSISKEVFFVGVHAGAGFSQAGLVNDNGNIKRLVLERTKIFGKDLFREQSSDEIWNSVVECVKKVVDGVEIKKIKGIGFTAISSMVCLDTQGSPLTVSILGKPERNCILYYDDRSRKEAEIINSKRHSVLRSYGGRVTSDLHESKLMWLKSHLKEKCWDQIGLIFDLPDFLTWKAAKSDLRSKCVAQTNWCYQFNEKYHGWDRSFFDELDLEELAKNDWKVIGSKFQDPGASVAEGLTKEAAREMGLLEGTPVATSMTDTHAACLRLLGCRADGIDKAFDRKFCMVCGTYAASHFAVCHQPVFVGGVWGPLKDCLVPGMWLSHAGQTTAESLIEHIIDHHPASAEIRKQLGQMNIQKYLNKMLRSMAKKRGLASVTYLTQNIHVYPDFRGNRSPRGDPTLRGMYSGLSLGSNQETLALLYLATMQSLACSTRHIMNAMVEGGHNIQHLIIGGGLGKNSIYAELNKDICQIPTVIPKPGSSRVIGAAILGAIAAKYFKSFEDAVKSMGGEGITGIPDNSTQDYSEKKYEIYLRMYDHQLEYKAIMNRWCRYMLQ
ncbi:FGGY carbohydrate kinase domain-containing protein-like [Cylas formicarius]|uniref:FGGY carbohydrate kinase domain-containing protein-like n=1 Tax=Cylas formicarius TaxID=197179 RepID=UPI0029584622|nr:FGGY carbohydrate kinase domain-containing protein-like [Cylas formicarius]